MPLIPSGLHNILPPNPPPPSPSSLANQHQPTRPTNHVHLPQLTSCCSTNPGQAVRVGMRRRIRRASPTAKQRNVGIEVKPGDLLPPDSSLCRLCGLTLPSPCDLYAHLMIIDHASVSRSENNSQSNVRLTCRRCGRTWYRQDDLFSLGEHACVYQKAVHLATRQVSIQSIRQGLPFTCLYCASYQAKNRRQCRSRLPPLIPSEVCSRFESKLHLIVHTLVRHDITRKANQCSHCGLVLSGSLMPVANERDFWRYPTRRRHRCNSEHNDSGSSSSESDSNSSDGFLLQRKGLDPLEKHIDSDHLPFYQALDWLARGRQPISQSNHSNINSIYDCSLCNMYATLSREGGCSLIGLPQRHLNSNAMLQAHIVCHHAGSSEMDALLGACKVCQHEGTSSFSTILTASDPTTSRLSVHDDGDHRSFRTISNPRIQHLIQSGHVNRLKAAFNVTLSQGRCCKVTPSELLWTNVCVLCWRRFSSSSTTNNDKSRQDYDNDDAFNQILSQCRLQVHLIVSHGQQHRERSNSRGGPSWSNACGWCGSVCTYPSPSECQDTSKLTKNRNIGQERVESDWKWFQGHEEAHARALALCWYLSPSKKSISH